VLIQIPVNRFSEGDVLMRTSSRRSRKEALGFLIFVGLTSSLVWLTHSSASNSVGTPRESLRVQSKEKPPRQCSSCPPPSSRRIYAPAIDLNEAQSCEIVLNSRSANPIDITPTFYTADGDGIIGNPIHLQPAEIRFVPVEQLMPRSIRGVHRWGGIALSYTGNVLEVWAQITFHGIGGGSIDETFNVLEEPGSDTREAVWWMPRQSTAILALGNSSGNAVRANVPSGIVEQRCDPPIAIAAVLRCQSYDRSCQRIFVRADNRCVTLCAAWLASERLRRVASCEQSSFRRIVSFRPYL